MTIKKKLMAVACMAVIVGMGSNAKADERLSVHEVNSFIANMTTAVNSVDPLIGKSFLKLNVSANAKFDTTTNFQWANTAYHHPVWYENENGVHYYRYPYYAHSPYYKPTSIQALGKWEQISQFENKKHVIPGYKQKVKTTNIDMPANAKSAIVDIELSEYGVHYVSGYYPYHLQNVKHAFSRCKMYLSKSGGDVLLTRMDCNKVQYTAL